MNLLRMSHQSSVLNRDRLVSEAMRHILALSPLSPGPSNRLDRARWLVVPCVPPRSDLERAPFYPLHFLLIIVRG